MWLLKELAPDHNTISNFRRDNEKAIRQVFRHTVSIAKQFNLIGGTLVAGDSTKLRAQNSKKNNFTPGKIEKHIGYIDARLDEYNKALSEADGDNKRIIEEQIAKHTERKKGYEAMSKFLEETGQVQVSTSDPESRQMITRNNITEVAYNVQTVVDAKHCLAIDYKVTNENDSKAMGACCAEPKPFFNHLILLHYTTKVTTLEVKLKQVLNLESISWLPFLKWLPTLRIQTTMLLILYTIKMLILLHVRKNIY